MADEITDALEDLATKPAAVEVDGQKLQERSLSEVIEADKHIDAKRARNAGKRPFKMTSLILPGPG